MAGKREISIGVDIVIGPNAGAKVKSVVKGVEGEVIASQKRISDSQKRHNRIMEDSDKAQARITKILAKQQADDFIREIKRVEDARKRADTEARQTSSIGASVFAGSFLGSAAAQGLSALTSQLTQAGRAVFDFSSKMQQSQVSFISLMGNSRLAASHIKDLQELTVKFPLDFSSIAMMSQRLQGAGIEAKRIIPLIKDIGNVAAATGDLGSERMEGLAVALSQVASKGRVSAEEMEQLSERGVPAWKLLSEAIGKTIGETRKMAEEGEITSDQLFKAFERMSRVNFAGAMERQAKTFSGAMKQIENVLLITASTAFKPFMDKISTLATKSAEEIKKQNGEWNSIGFTIGGALGEGISLAVAEAVQKLPAIIAGGVTGLARGLARNAIDSASSALDWFADSNDSFDRRVREANNRARNLFGGTPSPNNFSPRALPGTLPSRTGAAPLGSSIGRPSMSQLPDIFGNAPSPAGTTTAPNVDGKKTRKNFLPKTKSSKVNLNLKDEMSDALEITARYGAVVTSGKDGKHNVGSAHGSGGAFDVRTAGLSDAQVRALMSAYREAGYSVVDERARPKGQKEWFGSHLHVGGRTGGSRSAGGGFTSAASIQQNITAYLRNESDRLTKEREDELIDGFITLYVKTGLIPSDAMVDKITARAKEIAQAEGVLQPGRQEIVNELAAIQADKISRRTPSVSAGDTTISHEIFLQDTEALPEDPLVKEMQRRNQEIWENFRREQEDAFEDARQSWDNLLTDLANGDFKSVWRNLKDAMLQQFIRPASQMLAQLFGNPMGGMAGAGSGGFGGSMGGGFNLGSIFGGGSSMGPGGTPMFNPGSNFAGGSSGGGMLGGLFGGGGSGGGIGSMFGGLFGKGSSSGGGIGSAAAGALGGGGKGLSGMFRGMGGGSMMAGVGSGIGAGLGMLGGALGGKWGNMLSMTGMGAQVGAMFGPWGALIGGAIGAGAGLISMLFGRDNAEKKLKEAALSTYGITVKDKSVLKSLKQLGETMFGKGNVGKNAAQVVGSDEGQLILRNYAEATNQSSSKIDALYIGDENWKGNQFRSNFGGFRAMGGPVTAGKSYIVGEHRAEVFTPNTSGAISPSVGGYSQEDRMMIGTLTDAIHLFLDRVTTIDEGAFVAKGLDKNPAAAGRAMRTENANNLRASEMTLRSQGVY